MPHARYELADVLCLDDERRGTRFHKEPQTDTAVVWQRPGEELLVSVHDESLGGICIVAPADRTFAIGATATIVYHSDVMEAIVRHVDLQADNTSLVGFECHAWRGPAAHNSQRIP